MTTESEHLQLQREYASPSYTYEDLTDTSETEDVPESDTEEHGLLYDSEWHDSEAEEYDSDDLDIPIDPALAVQNDTTAIDNDDASTWQPALGTSQSVFGSASSGATTVPNASGHTAGGEEPSRSDENVAILPHLLQQLASAKSATSSPKSRCGDFVREMGVEAAENMIQGCSSKDLHNLAEVGVLTASTLAGFSFAKAKVWNSNGVYAHIIIDPDDDEYVGVYIGSALCVSARIKDHERDFKLSKKASKGRSLTGSTTRRSRRVLRFTHIKFWGRRPGIQSFWILLGCVDTSLGLSPDKTPLVLNILETYCMLVLRTLPLRSLWTQLPQGFNQQTRSWVGLNVGLPLDQWRPELGPMRLPKHRHPAKFETLKGITYRNADPSLGDKTQIEIVCTKCRSPQSRRIDNLPRYEKSSGVYLSWHRAHCEYCADGKMATFVPSDTSLPFRSFDYLRHKYSVEQAVQASTLVRARSDLSIMSKDRLEAYVASHGFDRRKFRFGSLSVLLQRAEAIWDFLQGPQTAEAEDSLRAFMASTVVQDNRPSRAAMNLKQIRHKDSKRKGVPIDIPPAATAPEATWVRRSPSPEAETSNSLSTEDVTIKIMTTEVKQPDLGSLKDVDLSTFPKCKRCFNLRHACNQGRPCSRCGDKWPCTQVTMKDLQESPEHTVYVLTGKKVPKPKKAEELAVNPSSFPKCDSCFRRNHTCCGGSPCEHCRKTTMVCIDVTEASLLAHPDRVKSVLEHHAQRSVPVSAVPCRYCVSIGVVCRRADLKNSCESCIRYRRRCNNDLKGVKPKGMYRTTNLCNDENGDGQASKDGRASGLIV
ncbi:hypothetical protein BFJ72_g6507 [Fusarium proliferatum]|uniref:Uncharacterized protein n=1 Tax=Gibberella intermedia TaxID=948311 RepID=A0A420TEB8_GIBIN|nr:hypothetical protein BFJ72_g6507 [Fusarium proliferatum]